MPNPISRAEILDRVKLIMRRDLKLGHDIPIDEKMPFFGTQADIDSLDILLLLTSIEREFSIKIPSEQVGREVFENLASLCNYLQSQLTGNAVSFAGNPGKQMSPADLLARLPHQPPFRFISRALTVHEGNSAEGIWSVSGREDFFRGHFPGRPIVPGVLIAEALAQLCGLAKSAPDSHGSLAKIDVRFDQSVAPPAEIQLSSQVARSIGKLIQYQVQASCRGTIVARGTITLGWSGENHPSAGPQPT